MYKSKMRFQIPVDSISKKKAGQSIKELIKSYREEIDWEDPFKKIKRENKLMDVMDIHGPRQKDEWTVEMFKKPLRVI